jgi:hypothetical protein
MAAQPDFPVVRNEKFVAIHIGLPGIYLSGINAPAHSTAPNSFVLARWTITSAHLA